MGGDERRKEYDDGRTGVTVQRREKRWDEQIPEVVKPLVQPYFLLEDLLKRRKEESEGASGGSKFVPGGGTFRDPKIDPKFVNPILRDNIGAQAKESTLGELYGYDSKDSKRVYDYEALKRLLELLNLDRERKPYGTPDNANIGF